jgi:hypothetical protein
MYYKRASDILDTQFGASALQNYLSSPGGPNVTGSDDTCIVKHILQIGNRVTDTLPVHAPCNRHNTRPCSV